MAAHAPRFSRRKRDDTLPIVLTRRRIYILPSGAGLLYAVVLCVMLIGAINYNLSLGHALVFLLAGLGLASMLHTVRNLHGLEFRPGPAMPVFAGQTAHFPLHCDNPLARARRALELQLGGEQPVVVHLPPSGRLTAALPCLAPRRGWLDPGRITVATRYPLGLFRAWAYPYPLMRCLVYPSAVETALPLWQTGTNPTGRRGRNGQDDFSGLRERQPNDPLRHIAWKAAARASAQQPLLVKQFDGGAPRELWLDWAQTAELGDTERRLSLLAGWVLVAERQHYRYGLRLPSRSISPGTGLPHRDACLKALALHA